jgi:hypothetical protein
MNHHATVWITTRDAKDLGIRGNEFPCRILDLKTLIYDLLKTGDPRDIVVLPFFRNFEEVVGHIRNRNISGPIIFYTNSEIMQMNLLDYASQGVIFLDSSRLNKLMVLGFISFLQKQQDLISDKNLQKNLPSKAYQNPSQDPKAIKDLFKNILNRRSKILLTCQFKENLPTLTVSCEIIKMVGKIETRLVLDNFNPEEFVILYNQLGNGKLISGFVSHGNESLGFDLEVDSSRMGKITVFLPEAVYEQKRKYFRVEPDPQEPVSIYIHPRDHETIGLAVRDISEGGVGVISSFAHLYKDDLCPVALVLPTKQILLGEAKVMFKAQPQSETYNYGMELSFHPSDLHYLQHYVYKRQAGILAAIKNLTI